MERAASPKGYKEVVRCSNASYSFKLQRNSSDLPYVISDVVDGTQRVDEFGRFYFDGYLAAPYLAFGRPIREIMERPDLGFKLLDVSEVTDVGRQFLKMAFEFRLAPNFPLAPAWIELDPEYGWAVHRFEGRFGPKQISRGGSVEYSGMERGRPVVRRVIHWSPTAEDTMDVTEIEFDRHPDPRDFTLSAFGLPEVNQKPGDARAIPLNYWLFGFGAVALALAILIRRSTRRRPASSVGQSV